jgi:hypothetical protein
MMTQALISLINPILLPTLGYPLLLLDFDYAQDLRITEPGRPEGGDCDHQTTLRRTRCSSTR